MAVLCQKVIVTFNDGSLTCTALSWPCLREMAHGLNGLVSHENVVAVV
jgi:hypothetical protein